MIDDDWNHGLSSHGRTILYRLGVRSLADLAKLSIEDVMMEPGCGILRAKEIRDWAASRGANLSDRSRVDWDLELVLAKKRSLAAYGVSGGSIERLATRPATTFSNTDVVREPVKIADDHHRRFLVRDILLELLRHGMPMDTMLTDLGAEHDAMIDSKFGRAAQLAVLWADRVVAIMNERHW